MEDELLKIPDDVLLKYSRREVGMLKAYIDELEYKIEQLKQSPENKDSEVYNNMKTQVKSLEKKNKSLEELNYKLIYENSQLKERLKKYI